MPHQDSLFFFLPPSCLSFVSFPFAMNKKFTVQHANYNHKSNWCHCRLVCFPFCCSFAETPIDKRNEKFNLSGGTTESELCHCLVTRLLFIESSETLVPVEIEKFRSWKENPNEMGRQTKKTSFSFLFLSLSLLINRISLVRLLDRRGVSSIDKTNEEKRI